MALPCNDDKGWQMMMMMMSGDGIDYYLD